MTKTKPTEPVLAHIHVPKCAGTSFRLLLDDIFTDRHLHLYSEPGTNRSLPTTFVYSEAQLGEFVEPSSTKALSSHFIRRFPNVINGRPILYVTFLRDPVQQFISYLSYTRQVFRHIQDPELLSHLPPNMADRSLRDCADWLLKQDSRTFRNFREN
jgi:hypothetical protein